MATKEDTPVLVVERGGAISVSIYLTVVDALEMISFTVIQKYFAIFY
jgi:hypothetical protein